MNEHALAQVVAQAKINLRLRILAREDTGYHQIETLFLRIALGDTVRIRRTPRERSLDVSGDVDLSALGPAEKNLAWRAAIAFADAAHWRGGFAIEVQKHIPLGGGLGGGSTNAAGVLRAMNAMTSTPLASLMDIAASLGADVPFLSGEAAYALAWGRGERMLALEPPPSQPLLLALPGFGVNTSEAYGWLDERGKPHVMATLLHTGRLSAWPMIARKAGNDFEDVVASRHPFLRQLIAQLGGGDVIVAQMTGSGSTAFGVYDTVETARRIQHVIGATGVKTLLTSTSTHVEPVQIIE